MDTVQLEGKFFTSHVKQGERIEQGQLLTTFDIAQIKGAGYTTVTPIVVTNLGDAKLSLTEAKSVKHGDHLMTVVR
jgi:PTS system beta-glucosides-specific IIC component